MTPTFKSLNPLALVVLFCALAGPMFLSAANEEHIPVGSREKSPEAIAQMEKQKEHKDKRCQKVARSGFLFDRYPPVYYSTNIHWFIAASAFGDSVELEDGSVWKVNRYDGYKALNWRMNDPLLITQNTRWFSSYNYRIVNQNTGTSIEANLFLGPIQNGEFTHYIVAIEPIRRILMLNDNTHWEVSSYDTSIFRDWAIGDAVITGYNSGWDSSSEGVLINVNMNNFIRVKQY